MHFLINERCPSWSAPMVGTRPMLFPLFFSDRIDAFRAAICSVICMVRTGCKDKDKIPFLQVVDA